MTLHEAIEKLLLQTRRPMSAREIAGELNKNKWYSKGDLSDIKPDQVTARVKNYQTLFDTDRTISPHLIKLFGRNLKPLVPLPKSVTKIKSAPVTIYDKTSIHSKTSFEPIADNDISILVLGTLPGDQSLKMAEYYGQARNRFWKIISTITNKPLPQTYTDKKKLLLQSGIAVWDVAHKANRKGSLDSAIENEEPNDLDTFIEIHKKLKVITFNGAKAEALYDRYFTRRAEIKYVSLPSTSPANAGISLADICDRWKVILKK